MSRLCTLLLFLLPWVAGILSGCGEKQVDSSRGPQAYPYQVTTTVGMITDIVGEVAGRHAVVKGIIAEGVDPHLYAATINDVKELRAADIIFYNGLNLEGKMGEVLGKLSRRKPVHAVAKGAVEVSGYALLDAEDHYDPHVWMDVRGWMSAVEVVRNSLQEFDPQHESDYSANAEGYLDTLKRLDAYAREVLGSIPENQRVLVTAHDAFGYMARAYGLEVRGIQGLSTEAKPGLRDIESLVEFLVERRIPAVFVESSVSRKSVEALMEGAHDKGHKVVIGGELFSDAMGGEGTSAGTYIGMIDHNVSTIARGLGGTVPEGGFREWIKDDR